MIEIPTTRAQHNAIREAHKERARVFANAFGWLFPGSSR